MSIKREQLSLKRGEERKSDGTNFDVVSWRERVKVLFLSIKDKVDIYDV